MEIGSQYYFAGCNGKPAGYCTFSETIGDLHCFDMEDGSSIAIGDEDMHAIIQMDKFHQMTLDEITAMSRAISSICSACCKPHDTGTCTIVDSQVLCADCLELHLQDEHENGHSSAYAQFMAKPGVKEALLQEAYGVDPKPTHTPEPWYSDDNIIRDKANLSQICIVTYDENPNNTHEDIANAKRIVECVNAFQHVQNPAKHIARLRANLDAYSEELRKVRAERDELIKVLQVCHASLRTYGEHPLIDNHVSKVIAQAKGGLDAID